MNPYPLARPFLFTLDPERAHDLALRSLDSAARCGLVRALAGVFSPEGLLAAIDAINQARDRINANVPPLLALEAMALQLRMPRDLGA